MHIMQNNQYEFSLDIKGNKGPISSVVFSSDATIMFIGSDDGHVRVYSTKDFVHIQTLHDSAWGKVTALSYIYKPDAGDKVEIICVGSIRGSISLIPKSKQNSWFAQRSSMSLQAFEFNDSVAVQSFDATNQRLAIASHSGTLKLFSVDAGVDLIELWSIASQSHAIPIGLAFFGGGNQSLLVHNIENGEMLCRDAQTSEIIWQKYLTCAIGNAALSPREDSLLVHNLTERYMQVHRFPGSLPEAILPASFQRQITIQAAWAEDGKIAVCGSDHDTIYVFDMATREIIQKLPMSGQIQAVATAELSNGKHVIVGGSSSGSFTTSVWVKQPVNPVNEPVVVHSAPLMDKWPRTAERGALLILCLAIVIMHFFPTFSYRSLNPIPVIASRLALATQDSVAPASTTSASSVVLTHTVYQTVEPLISTEFATAREAMITYVTRTVTVAPDVVTRTVTTSLVHETTVSTVPHIGSVVHQPVEETSTSSTARSEGSDASEAAGVHLVPVLL